jgi:hypothetical protein
MDDKNPNNTNEPDTGSPETIRVRQGIGGQGVRYVLAFSLAGVVLAFIVLATFM